MLLNGSQANKLTSTDYKTLKCTKLDNNLQRIHFLNMYSTWITISSSINQLINQLCFIMVWTDRPIHAIDRYKF